MGKIHKALEKSKKERQDKSKSSSFATLGTKISPKESTSQLTGGRERDPAASFPASQGLDLGTIHELLHESGDTGVPKNRDKNDTVSNEIQDAPASGKAPFAALPAEENSKLSVIRNEETIIADPEFGKKDDLRKTIEAQDIQDPQNVILPDAPSIKTSLPGSTEKSAVSAKPMKGQQYDSAKSKKISALTPNETDDKRIFVLKEKTHKAFSRAEVTDKTINDDVHKNDPTERVSDSTQYGAVDNSLVALLKPRSYEAEQFKILRTNLLFPESGHPARCILITSAAPGDGKSFVSANLAISLALNQDRKVLLIDADVRRSEIHKIFGLNHVEKGICDFLAYQTPLISLLVKTSLKNLVILPAGKLMRNPAELQSLEKLPKLFEELAAHFGEYFIVIDSPPPKLASETGVLARLVDSIVIVMKSGVTKKEYVEETIDLLEKEKIAGIVFNWHDNRMSNYKKYAKDREYYS
jgi:protein-tyrosine kinase